MKIEPRTLKGFRDFLPKEARKRQYVLEILKKVFESYGFEPLETPALEYEDILTGKYGDEGDKLMYRFVDNGDRKVVLRYDQTVPLARVVAQYQNELPMPFKRYQIQNVWRAENTQKGRYREFLQVDVDTVGSSSPLVDLEILQLVYDSFKKLGFKIKIKINDRNLLKELPTGVILALDKLNKIGEESVLLELQKIGKSSEEAKKILASTRAINASIELKNLKEEFEKNNPNDILTFDPTLARGLNYYTGFIFEVFPSDDSYALSLGGGGRYDKLIGIFSGSDIPAVGFSFGFDRIIETMEELKLFPENLETTKVLVTNSNKALEIAAKLRAENINTEVYLEEKDLEKQLKYADKKQIPYVIIINDKGLILKDMQKRTQEELSLKEIINKLK